MKDKEYIEQLAKQISEDINDEQDKGKDENLNDEDLSSFDDKSYYSETDTDLDFINVSEVQYPKKPFHFGNDRRPRVGNAVFLIYADNQQPIDRYNILVRYSIGYDRGYESFDHQSNYVSLDLRHAILSLALDYDLTDKLNFKWQIGTRGLEFINDPNNFMLLLLGENPDPQNEYPAEDFYTDFAEAIIGFINQYYYKWYQIKPEKIDRNILNRFEQRLPEIITKIKNSPEFYDQIGISNYDALDVFIARAKQGPDS